MADLFPKVESTLIDKFRDMGDRDVIVEVLHGCVRVNGTIRLDIGKDIDRLIEALQKARSFARGRK